MANITISMDEVTARWVRIEAAKAGKSVSRWVGEVLTARRHSAEDAEWEAGHEARLEAGRAFLASPLRPLSQDGRLPSREELNDEVFRRYEHSGLREGQPEPYKTSDGGDLD